MIFFIPDHTSLTIFCWSFLLFSVHLLALCCFLFLFFFFLNCTQELPVSLPEGFLFYVQQPFQVTGDPEFVPGEAPHSPCGNKTHHTKVQVIITHSFIALISSQSGSLWYLHLCFCCCSYCLFRFHIVLNWGEMHLSPEYAPAAMFQWIT